MLIRIAANLSQLKANLAEGKNQIEITTAACAKLANSLDGSKLDQRAHNITAAIHAIGGATKLTDAEALRHLKTLDAWIEKGNRMGKEIPADILKTRDALVRVDAAQDKVTKGGTNWLGMLTKIGAAVGIAFSVGAIKNFVGSVFDAATNIHDTALKLGVSTDAMQGFKFAAEQGGSSLDTVGSALTKMNSELAGGDKATVKALKDAGLGFQAIRSMKPEDAFLAITDAIAKIPDPMIQSDVALKLFGKSAAELLPAIKEGFRGVSDSAEKMSQETIDSLEKAGDAWEKFGNKIVLVTGTALAKSMSVTGEITKSWTAFATMAKDTLQLGVGGAWLKAAAAAEEAARKAKLGHDVNLALIPTFHQTAEGLAAIEAAAKKAAIAAAKYAEVERDILAAAIPLTIQQKEQIIAMDKLGISTSKMAEFLKISEFPIKKYNDALKEQAKAIAEIGKQLDKIPHNVKLRLETTNLGGAVPMIDVEAVKKASGAVKKISDATWGDIEGRMKAMGVNTSAELGRLAMVARERFDSMKASGKFTADELAAAWKKSQAAMDAALGKTGGLFGSLMAALKGSSGDLSGMLSNVITGGMGVGTALKGYATNVAKDFAGTALAMIPGIGPMLAEFAGPIVDGLKKMFGSIFGIGTAGRDIVKDFAASFGGFDAFHAMLGEKLPADAERLWIALTQGVGRNNPEQAKAIIDQITAALAAQKDKTDEVAAAAAASSAMQTAALDAISAKYSDSISKLESEYKSLSDSVAKEAEEAVMGLTEANERERMKQIEAEKAAQMLMRDTELAAKQEMFDGMLTAGQQVDAELRAIFGKPLEIPYHFTPQNAPNYGSGGGGGGTSSGGGSSRSDGSQTIVVQVDGEVLTRAVVNTAKRHGAT